MKSKAFIVLFLLLAFTGCSKKEITPEEASEVIKEFNSEEYSYTLEVFNLGKDGTKEVLDNREGMKTESPYRQYEITTSDTPQGEYEKYWIEDDGYISFYVNLAFSDGQISEWIPSGGEAKKEGRGTGSYDRDGLVYEFDRLEEPYFVVCTEYDVDAAFNSFLLGLSEDPNATVNMTVPVKVEYYIDRESEKVDQIHVLYIGAGRMQEISNLVSNGMSYEEAENAVDESGDYGYLEMDYRITYEDDIEINIPDELPKQ